MKRLLFLLSFSISGALPVCAEGIDKISDYRIGAIWREIEKRPDMKATSDMPAVDMIVTREGNSNSAATGWLMRTNWLAGENLKLQKGFSVLITRPCPLVIQECYRAEGLWMEIKRAGK